MESCNKKEEYCLVIRVRQLLQKHHKWSCTCVKILVYVTYVGKYQEAVYQMSYQGFIQALTYLRLPEVKTQS